MIVHVGQDFRSSIRTPNMCVCLYRSPPIENLWGKKTTAMNSCLTVELDMIILNEKPLANFPQAK